MTTATTKRTRPNPRKVSFGVYEWRGFTLVSSRADHPWAPSTSATWQITAAPEGHGNKVHLFGDTLSGLAADLEMALYYEDLSYEIDGNDVAVFAGTLLLVTVTLHDLQANGPRAVRGRMARGNGVAMGKWKVDPKAVLAALTIAHDEAVDRGLITGYEEEVAA